MTTGRAGTTRSIIAVQTSVNLKSSNGGRGRSRRGPKPLSDATQAQLGKTVAKVARFSATVKPS